MDLEWRRAESSLWEFLMPLQLNCRMALLGDVVGGEGVELRGVLGGGAGGGEGREDEDEGGWGRGVMRDVKGEK